MQKNIYPTIIRLAREGGFQIDRHLRRALAPCHHGERLQARQEKHESHPRTSPPRLCSQGAAERTAPPAARGAPAPKRVVCLGEGGHPRDQFVLFFRRGGNGPLPLSPRRLERGGQGVTGLTELRVGISQPLASGLSLRAAAFQVADQSVRGLEVRR